MTAAEQRGDQHNDDAVGTQTATRTAGDVNRRTFASLQTDADAPGRQTAN